ncbi:hypothetical protein AB0C38_15715 [Amycolatopsis sp. NPDC048633]|uniref:hypothetical protein n=1 Tax=Amycolatopsis sp. NPDC048633 TaxID=3157095 RepID=UPI0033D7CF7F
MSAGQEQGPLQGGQVSLGRRTGPGGGHARLGQHTGHPLPLIGEERVRRLPHLNGQALRIHGEDAAEADAAALGEGLGVQSGTTHQALPRARRVVVDFLSRSGESFPIGPRHG